MNVLKTLKQFTETFPTNSFFLCESTPAAILKKPLSPTATILLCFRDGVAYEPENLWGISHFVEHILFRGCEKYPTLFDISRQAEAMGGMVSAYSTRDMTGFWVKFIPGGEKTALDLLEQLVVHPTLQLNFIEAEKSIIYQERQREINNPAFFSSLVIENLLLLPEPISRHPVGEDEIIKKIDATLLSNYIKQVYHRKNMAVAAAGNLPDNFPGMIESVISRFPDGIASSWANFKIEAESANSGVVILPSHHKNQVFLSMGWKFPVNDRLEMLTWRVLNTMLGAGYTSLLNRLLRERENIAYLCTTGFNIYNDTAILKINTSIADSNLEKALNLIEDLIEDIKEGKISPQIFSEAVIRHASNLVFRMEDSLEIAKILATSLIKKEKAFSFSNYIEQLTEVSLPLMANLTQKNLTESNKKVFLQTGSEMAIKKFPNAFQLKRREIREK